MRQLFLLLAIAIIFALPAKAAPLDGVKPLPKDIAAVADPFMAAITAGKPEEARRYVDAASRQKFDLDFADRDPIRPSRQLKLVGHSGEFRDIERNPASGPPESYAVTYSRKIDDENWERFRIELYDAGDGPKIEDWSYETDAAAPRRVAEQEFRDDMLYIGLPVLAGFILLIAGLIWFFWRRYRDKPEGTRFSGRPVAVATVGTDRFEAETPHPPRRSAVVTRKDTPE